MDRMLQKIFIGLMITAAVPGYGREAKQFDKQLNDNFRKIDNLNQGIADKKIKYNNILHEIIGKLTPIKDLVTSKETNTVYRKEVRTLANLKKEIDTLDKERNKVIEKRLVIEKERNKAVEKRLVIEKEQQRSQQKGRASKTIPQVMTEHDPYAAIRDIAKTVDIDFNQKPHRKGLVLTGEELHAKVQKAPADMDVAERRLQRLNSELQTKQPEAKHKTIMESNQKAVETHKVTIEKHKMYLEKVNARAHQSRSLRERFRDFFKW